MINGVEKLNEALRPERLRCRFVHGSTGSPRTDHVKLQINYLAVRPELVEGREANYDTVPKGGVTESGVAYASIERIQL